jgi:6-pyruvoyl tetrahydropterin synthase/QueD family protein
MRGARCSCSLSIPDVSPFAYKGLVLVAWKVLIERGNLGFSAAHFITFDEHTAEPLHGHNYGVRVEVIGDLNADSYVLDFVALKTITREICKGLDHRFLLPRQSRHLKITEHPDEWEIRFGDQRYLLPHASVVALPFDNATAERLAEYLARQIIERLCVLGATNLTTMTVGVEETEMQTAFYTLDLRA